MAQRPSFALCVPTFAFPGPAMFRVPGWPELDASVAVAAAVKAEALGFDAVWVPDHYMIGADKAVLDGWTTLSFIAGATRRVRLCLIQQSTLFRHAPQLAKMTATLDQLSGGRLTVFSSLGRAEVEHRAYGFPWHDDFATRLARHTETLDLLQQMWTDGNRVSHEGDHFVLRDAVCLPPPRQQPHPPLWLAGSEPELLDLTARVGAGWNTPPVSVDEFRRLRAALATALDGVCRDIAELTVSLETQVLVRPTIEALRTTLHRLASLPARDGQTRPPLLDPLKDPFLLGETDELPSALTDRYIIGTPDQVRDRLDSYVEAGVNAFGCWFMDFPDGSSLELLAHLADLKR
jgi:alkanesulfonate monooxygenase SsuD/methylene tetrahydromethanopterin reductase-like flavin-dependent oxidoreductase (luciferase family)